MKKLILGLVVVAFLTLAVACDVEPPKHIDPVYTPSPEESNYPTEYGPEIHCRYYPKYNVSVLYIILSSSHKAAMAGHFINGNACYPPTSYFNGPPKLGDQAR